MTHLDWGMPPDRSDYPPSLGRLAAALLASLVLACSLVDDDQPPPVGDTGVEPGICSAQLEAAKAQCLPGMVFESIIEGGGGTVILIDDPGAAVGVGPNGWLVQVAAEADYVASYQFEGPTCTAVCGWCARGQSICHQGFDASGTPVGCVLCLPHDVPDPGAQCAEFMAACVGVDGTGPDGDGADETGADSEAMAFDCRDWALAEAVVVDGRGTVIVDAGVVEMAAVHFGEPLAQCDGTRFRRRADGYFEVSALSASGLLAQIGLEHGDAILEIDGEPMQEADRLIAKAMELFLGARPASELTLVVERREQAVTTNIQIR
jgi:hypothetical protein